MIPFNIVNLPRDLLIANGVPQIIYHPSIRKILIKKEDTKQMEH